MVSKLRCSQWRRHLEWKSLSLSLSTNTLLWNAIIRLYVATGSHHNAIQLFVQMRHSGILGDRFTFPLAIRACANSASHSACRALHALALGIGLGRHLHSANELLAMYAKHGDSKTARKLFDEMPLRNHVSWNIVLSLFSISRNCDGAIDVFRKMEVSGLKPNVVSWVSLLSCHSRANKNHETLNLFRLMMRKGVNPNAEALAVTLSSTSCMIDRIGGIYHTCAVKLGFETYSIVGNSLVCLYGKFGEIESAKKLFERIENKTIVSWNAIITAYVNSGLCDEAFGVFSKIKNPNVVTWSAIINGYSSKGRFKESLNVFRKMGFYEPVTMASVLSVCAELSATKLGKEIHGRAIRVLLEKEIIVGNGLINMYFKCGCLREGKMVFWLLKVKDIVSWNSVINGYARNGGYEDVLKVFDEMTGRGVRPDGVTFLGILTACRHCGLVEEGKGFFEKMVREYEMEPQMQHYACLVDLLGRGGFMKEAIEVIKSMPMKPNKFVLGTILSSKDAVSRFGFEEFFE